VAGAHDGVVHVLVAPVLLHPHVAVRVLRHPHPAPPAQDLVRLHRNNNLCEQDRYESVASAEEWANTPQDRTKGSSVGAPCGCWRLSSSRGRKRCVRLAGWTRRFVGTCRKAARCCIPASCPRRKSTRRCRPRSRCACKSRHRTYPPTPGRRPRKTPPRRHTLDLYTCKYRCMCRWRGWGTCTRTSEIE